MTVKQDRRRFQQDAHGQVLLRAAPLDEGEIDAAGGGRNADAQGRWRRVACTGQGPHEEKQRLATLRGQVQAAQRVIADMGLPKQNRAASAGAQQLLGGPKGIGRTLAANPQQTFGRHAPTGQCERLRRLRRLNQGDRPLTDLPQCGAQQAQLPQTRLADQKFDQRRRWPTATRQLGRQHRIAGGDGATVRPGQLGG